MGWTATWTAVGGALLLLLIASRMNAKRGIGRWSLLPWDHAMILAVIVLLTALAHAALLWRDTRLY